jgi:hypothetical protein
MDKAIEDLMPLISVLSTRDQKFVARMMRIALVTIENRNTMTEEQRYVLRGLSRETRYERFKIRNG